MDVLLIGVDAACPSVLDMLFETESVPNIRGLIDDGVVSQLQSQIPPWTPSAWPSIYTGVNPGKHGAFGFVQFDGYDWEVVSAEHVRERSLWSLLAEHGLTSVVVNVPVTYPSDDIDGAIVPGFIGPEDPDCSPPGLLEDIRDAIGEYRVYPEYARGDTDYSDDEKMDEYCRLAKFRGQAFRYLSDEFDPDFGFVQFQKTDTVFHEFDGQTEKVRRIYEETDDQIGKILDHCDPTYVFLVSDHGIGPYDGHEFRVNEHLKERGYLESTFEGKGMPSWNPIRSQLRQGETTRTWDPGVISQMAALPAKVGISPSDVVSKLERFGLADVVRRHAPASMVRTSTEQVDFPSSTAYMRARTELGVRINLESREPEGIVPQEEYEAVRQELIELLQRVRTPDGDPVFQAVRPREEFFHGPYAEDAVDIVTIPNEFNQFLSANLAGERFGPPTEPWNHKLDGVIVAAGGDIDTTARLENPHIFDVAPTVMAAFGLPISDRMDGTVLPLIEDTGRKSYPSYRSSARSDRDVSDVEERLSDLGYFE